VLAGAGLQRLTRDPDAPPLGLGDLIDTRLDPAVFVPSPAQGALALQCRVDDEVAGVLIPLHDEGAARLVRAERELLRLVDGGCSLPFGAWARPIEHDRLELIAVIEAEGRLLYAHNHGASPEELAARVWQALEVEAGGALTAGAETRR
jgi:hydroxymethylbilane synthase